MRWNMKGNTEIHFTGEPEEIEALDVALSSGMYWVRHTKKRGLEKVHAFKEIPELVDDDISPFFTKVVYFQPGNVKRLDKNLHDEEKDRKRDPSFFVQSIYGYSDNYEKKAKMLEEVGFECLRSRRGKDGKYWEIWYLPGIWRLKGELKGKKTEDVIRFLCSLGVGSFETSGRHWGLSAD